MKYLLLIATLALSLGLLATPGQAQAQYPNGYYGQTQNWRGALSPKDQQDFDKYYSKWMDAERKNDRDDITKNAQHMQDIMARNNIPSNVPFDQIASNGVPGYGPNQGPYGPYPNGTYPNGAYPSASYPNGTYPNGAYPYPTYGQTRLSPDDQRKFDKAYEKWMDAQRKNDQDDVSKHAAEMNEIMARYNIPNNVPFAQIATNGYAAGPNGAAPYPYPYGQAGQRLSSKDQKDFDNDYRHWLDARRKKDMDDVDKNARKMEEIMARYNIPANVPFDEIASAGAYH